MSALTDLPVAQLRERFGLAAFIETGCFLGDGIATALGAGFARAYSCDINEECIARCQSRFGGDPRVRLILGQSVAALAECCLSETAPALFWLDAHFPGHYGLSEPAGTRFPLADELGVIAGLRAHPELDVIAFDDLRVIDSPDNPRWRAGETGAYYQVPISSLKEFLALFAQTHETELLMVAEGIGLLTPLQEAGSRRFNRQDR